MYHDGSQNMLTSVMILIESTKFVAETVENGIRDLRVHSKGWKCLKTVCTQWQGICNDGAKDALANTTEHKLAVCMTFIRAIYMCNYEKATSLQLKCSELTKVRVGHGTIFSQAFTAVKETTAELMRTDIWERYDELRRVQESLPEHMFDERKHGIALLLRRMLPGGIADIAVVIDSIGNVITDGADIADCLNSH